MSQPLPAYFCKADSHRNSPVLLLCVDPYCLENRLCCVHCAEDLHRRHDLISIAKFEEEMEAQLQGNNNHPHKQIILNEIKK